MNDIDTVLEFCVYGTMLEDHFNVKREDVLSESEYKVAEKIFDTALSDYSYEQILDMYKRKFRNAVDSLLSDYKE